MLNKRKNKGELFTVTLIVYLAAMSGYVSNRPCDWKFALSEVLCSVCLVSDSQGLVDFAIGLVVFVLNLPDGQVLFFGKFKLQKDCNQSS